jgi:[heparan sulfate]-glucosamine 3-sulfotransferase 5
MPYTYPEQITLEKSPRYFITEKAPERIYRMNSSIKLIVLLRNPTTRVISDYTQVYYNKLAKGKDTDKFEDLVIDKKTKAVNTGFRAVQISVYYHHLLRWLKFFKREQIHVVDGDKLITDPLNEINKVEQFLGLPTKVTEKNIYFNTTRGFYCMRTPKVEQKCLGLTKGRKHPHIEHSVLQKLNDFFRPHNKKLFSLIDQRFDWD